MRAVKKIATWFGQKKRRLRERERGQSLVIMAIAMIVLIAFAGIVTDVAILYVQYGHLRRAADSAAVAAAGQMREGRRYSEIVNAARETIAFHGLEVTDSTTVFVPPYLGGADHYDTICSGDLTGLLEGEDPTLCHEPPRKLVRVQAEARVYVAFMRILGFESIPLRAVAEGEAATLDVALVLDRSWSMAWDTAGCDIEDDPLGCEAITTECNDTNPTISCEPMAQVLDASLRFMDRLQEPFDRAALITFDRHAGTVVSMTRQLDSEIMSVLEGDVPEKKITVYNDEMNCRMPVSMGGQGNAIWQCTNTNLGAGLAYANNQFTHPSLRRDDSVWVMIVLSDGGANAALGVENYCDSTDEGCCPPDHQWDPDYGIDGGDPPPCRDESADTRHCGAEELDDCNQGGLDSGDWPADWTHEPVAYDAEDFARDMADFAALKPPLGNYIVIFTIGLGDGVTEYGFWQDAGGGWSEHYGDRDAGEQLLRYVANVGYNGEYNTGAADLCDPTVYGVGIGDDCGNYYYAPDPQGLEQIFSEIASRIFTRITR